jgi:membrane-associated phospholipid phosphatase
MTLSTFKSIFAISCVVFLCEAQPLGSIGSDSSNAVPAEGIPKKIPQESPKIIEDSESSTNYILIGSAGAVAITALLFQYDQKIYDKFYDVKRNNQFVKDSGPIVSYLGDGTISFGLFGGFVGYGLAFKDKKAIEVGKIGIESFLFSGLAVQLFKHLCGRERPSASTRPGGFWSGPFAFFRQPTGVSKGIASFDAFPSGHTASAFAAATTLSDYYTEPWVSYTSYSLATLCAISRITESTHWMSDCFIGAIIGFYGTRIIEKINYGTTDVTIIPFVDASQSGLCLSVKL